MRILIINSEYPPIGGGAGNASANIARCLAADGHAVTVLTARYGDLPAQRMEDGVSVHRIPALRRRQDRSDAVEQLVFIAAAALRSSSLVQEFRADVTLAFFGMPCGAIGWLIKKKHGVPYVVSLRGGDVPGFRPYDFRMYHKLTGPLLRVIWHQARAVVANSRGLRDLARLFDSTIEIPIIPNGVELQRYTADRREWSPARIFSVGRVVYQKGFDLGLRALAGLKELDWEWYIAGDGAQLPALQLQARELGISARVHFLGWQSRDDLSKWYHQANLFLFPSRHEGMSNAVLEAMASGLPVVATRIAGNEELVLDGVTGRLVNAEDVRSLQDGLRPLLTDAQAREHMGRAGRRRVEQEYTWESATRQYEMVLENAVKSVTEEALNH
jgi:glycosyltransferase involved in cell wall biosynthesis